MKSNVAVEENVISKYKNGLDESRRIFRLAKLENNYDAMADSVENIKSEIKFKMIASGDSDIVIRIEAICDWYRNKESHYTRPTPDGYRIVFPPNMFHMVNKNLTIAYELLMRELEKLKLL